MSFIKMMFLLKQCKNYIVKQTIYKFLKQEKKWNLKRISLV